MINLFTGSPGTGKTAYIMSLLVKLIKLGRPLYVHGVPGLKIEHTAVACDSPHCKVCPSDMEERKKMPQATEWNDWAPEGAILFFDEVQNIYRPRSSGSKLPPSIMAFETHRHDGIDFYLASQSPMLFDSNIRQLVNRHVHLRQNWAGRKQFEWGECKNNPSSSTAGSIDSSYKLDKKIFDLYKSSSMHTTVKRKIPLALYAFPLLMLVLGVMIYSVYSSVSEKIHPKELQVSNDIGGRAVPGAPATGAALTPLQSQTVFSNELDRKPMIANVPESAPIYSGLVEATDFPILSACLINESTGSCKCYTQQATEYKTTERACYEHVKGRRFNPYQSTYAKNDQNQNNRISSVQPNQQNLAVAYKYN